MTIVEKQENLIKEFSGFKDWEARYQRIINLGKTLSALEDKYKTEQNRVKGCQSQAWLHARLDGNKIIYEADSDAMIVRGLIAILIHIYSDHEPQEILKSGSDFLEKIGLTTHLSQSRANGLAALVRQFKNYAIAFDVLSKGNKKA